MSQSEEKVSTYAGLVYSRAGGSPRLADAYVPDPSSAPVGVVIWLHGGGWRFGDRRLAPNLELFAQHSGLAVVSIDYRLSDEVKFPAPVEDVKAAVRWVRSVARRYGFNPDRIGLWGSSAGAHLATCAALSREDQFLSGEHAGFSSSVQAVVDGYGPTNFGRIDEDRLLMQANRPVQSNGKDAESVIVAGGVLPAGHANSFESRLLGEPVSESPRLVELADPVHYARSGCPPFLILHGEADTLIPCNQSRYLFDALSSFRCDATLVLFEKLKHGFLIDPNLAQEDYGSVTVHRTTNRNAENWIDSSGDIAAMVSSFFRGHLAYGVA